MADENEESQAGENEAPKKDAKRKKEAFPALNRPIILVCNDGWARAVRPVIPIVLRMKIQCASEAKLEARVCEILRREGIRGVDKMSAAIREIVEQSNGDARSCINRVQVLVTSQTSAAGKQAQGDPGKALALT